MWASEPTFLSKELETADKVQQTCRYKSVKQENNHSKKGGVLENRGIISPSLFWCWPSRLFQNAKQSHSNLLIVFLYVRHTAYNIYRISSLLVGLAWDCY